MGSTRLLAWPALYGGAVFGGVFWASLVIQLKLLQSRPAATPLTTAIIAVGVALVGCAVHLIPRGWANVAGGVVAVGALLGLPVLGCLAAWTA